MEFRCDSCKVIFEDKGWKYEYMDPIYGPCSRMISNCPQCGAETSEYRKPKPSKSSKQADPSCPAYQSGSCGCCN